MLRLLPADVLPGLYCICLQLWFVCWPFCHCVGTKPGVVESARFQNFSQRDQQESLDRCKEDWCWIGLVWTWYFKTDCCEHALLCWVMGSSTKKNYITHIMAHQSQIEVCLWNIWSDEIKLELRGHILLNSDKTKFIILGPKQLEIALSSNITKIREILSKSNAEIWTHAFFFNFRLDYYNIILSGCPNNNPKKKINQWMK